MKKAILTVAVLMAFAVSAQAKREKLYIIDFTGKNFANNGFNLMDDGLDLSPYSGIGMRVAGQIGEDFSVTVTPSSQDAKCAFHVAGKTPDFTILALDASVETDSGDTCDFTITTKHGRKATLSVTEEGT